MKRAIEGTISWLIVIGMCIVVANQYVLFMRWAGWVVS